MHTRKIQMSALYPHLPSHTRLFYIVSANTDPVESRTTRKIRLISSSSPENIGYSIYKDFNSLTRLLEAPLDETLLYKSEKITSALTEKISSLTYHKDNPVIENLQKLLKHDCGNSLTGIMLALPMYTKYDVGNFRHLNTAKEALKNLKETFKNYEKSIMFIMQPQELNQTLGATQEITSLEQLKEYFPRSGIGASLKSQNNLADTDLPIKLDPNLLKAILQNLVDNASENSPKDSTVNFSIGKTGDFLKIEVKNPIKDVTQFIKDNIGAKLEQGEQVTSKINPSQTNGTFLKTVKALLHDSGGNMKLTYPKSTSDKEALFTVRLNYPLEKTSGI
jgi:K+-sensing histidine kinase KdpD